MSPSGNGKKQQKKTVLSRTSVFRVCFLLIALIIVSIAALVLVKLIRVSTQYEQIAENAGDYSRFQEMIASNPDVIAWLTVDQTKISTVVVQGNNNLEYIDRDVNRKRSFGGTPFLDYRNSQDFSDVYSVIYGHYMEDHLMFADLELFKDSAFWKETRKGTLELATGTVYDICFFACKKVKADESMYLDPVRVGNNWNDDFFRLKMTEDTLPGKETIEQNDHILVLSTCVTADSENRILVFGKLNKKEQ